MQNIFSLLTLLLHTFSTPLRPHRKLRAVSFLYGSREMCRLKGQENGGGGSAWVLWDQVQIWASLHSLILHSLDKQHSLALNCEEDHLNPAGRPLGSRPVVLPLLTSSDKSGFFLLFCVPFYANRQSADRGKEVWPDLTIFFAYFPSHSDRDAQADKQTDFF